MSEPWVATYRVVHSTMTTTVTTGHDEDRQKVRLGVLVFEVEPMHGKDHVRLFLGTQVVDQLLEALSLLKEDLSD